MIGTSPQVATAMPAISVVVYAVAGGERLATSLASVASQPASDAEIIVIPRDQATCDLATVDFGSVRLARPTRPMAGACWAAGLRAACGLYVAYCDEGDVWASNHLAELRTAIEAAPAADLVCAAGQWVDERGAQVAEPVWQPLDPRPLLTPTSTVMHRADAARAVGGFDAYLDCFADLDLWLRMSEWGRFRQVPAVEVRLLASSRLRARDAQRRADETRLLRYVRHIRPRASVAPMPPRRAAFPPFDERSGDAARSSSRPPFRRRAATASWHASWCRRWRGRASRRCSGRERLRRYHQSWRPTCGPRRLRSGWR
jgi:hypothetical protein